MPKYECEINADKESENPRSWGAETGVMYCIKDRFHIWGDEQFDFEDFDNNWGEVEDYLYYERNAEVLLSLVLEEHGYNQFKIGNIHDADEEGRIGYIFADAETVSNSGSQEDVEEILRAEIDLYNMWLSGDVWSLLVWTVDDSGEKDEVVDSINGIFGYENAIEQSKEFFANYREINDEEEPTEIDEE